MSSAASIRQVRRAVRIGACLAALAVALLPASAALAQGGTGTSAGDQQYIDPLTTTTSAPAPSTSSSSAPAAPTASSSSGSSSSAPAPTATTAGSPPTTTAPTSSGTDATASSTGGTLPFTGLNVEACAAVGLALLGAGLLLRRAVRRA